jgi:hypothetical protein
MQASLPWELSAWTESTGGLSEDFSNQNHILQSRHCHSRYGSNEILLSGYILHLGKRTWRQQQKTSSTKHCLLLDTYAYIKVIIMNVT